MHVLVIDGNEKDDMFYIFLFAKHYDRVRTAPGIPGKQLEF
jgi:hypothetical protein